MARPAIISETVLSVMQSMARKLPDDVESVKEADVYTEPRLADYRKTQIASALILLERNGKIFSNGKNQFKVPQPLRPIDGFSIPARTVSRLGLSDEGIFFLQMTRMTGGSRLAS